MLSREMVQKIHEERLHDAFHSVNYLKKIYRFKVFIYHEQPFNICKLIISKQQQTLFFLSLLLFQCMHQEEEEKKL